MLHYALRITHYFKCQSRRSLTTHSVYSLNFKGTRVLWKTLEKAKNAMSLRLLGGSATNLAKSVLVQRTRSNLNLNNPLLAAKAIATTTSNILSEWLLLFNNNNTCNKFYDETRAVTSCYKKPSFITFFGNDSLLHVPTLVLSQLYLQFDVIPPSIFDPSFDPSAHDDLDQTEEQEQKEEDDDDEQDKFHLGLWLISTLKRRKKKMNKHKLRKRRKKNRLKNKK